MNWLVRAKAELANNAAGGTDKTDERNLTSVLSVPDAAMVGNFADRTVSNVSFVSANWAPMTEKEEARILAWLAAIGETDAANIAHVLQCCRTNAKERQGLLKLADALLPPANE